MQKLLLTVLLLTQMSWSGASSEFQLVGKALLEYTIFGIDIYEISYLKDPQGGEKLVLDYKTDVEAKYSREGWRQGLAPVLAEKPKLQKQLEWLLSHTLDFKEGDRFTIERRGERVSFYKNSDKTAELKDPDLAHIVFDPWLGKSPIDKKIKRQLLAEQEGAGENPHQRCDRFSGKPAC